MKCTKCGADLEENALFCGECGTKVEVEKKKLYCMVCGSEMVEGENTCRICGRNISTIEVEIKDGESGENIDEKVDKTEYQHKVDTDISRLESYKEKLLNKWINLDFTCKIITVALIIIAIMICASVYNHKVLAIIFSIVQFIGIIVSLFMHTEIIKVSKKWIQYVILFISIAFSILTLMSYSWGNKEKVIDSYHEDEKIVTVLAPIDAETVIGQDYAKIQSDFEDAGFTNVYVKEIEDLTIEDADKFGLVESISINYDSKFKANDEFDSNSEVIIKYHGYIKYKVSIHVNFVENWFFNKYDVTFKVDGSYSGSLTHGEDDDFELLLEPGKHIFSFVSVDSDDVKGEVTIDIVDDKNVTYTIYCYGSKISVEGNDTEKQEESQIVDTQEEEIQTEETQDTSNENDSVSETSEEEDTILTVDNCPELKEMLKSNDCDVFLNFARKYSGRKIAFDCYVADVANNGSYKTRFNYLLYIGDYNPEYSQTGSSIQLRDINYYDFHFKGDSPDSVPEGMNLHMVAKIENYDYEHGLLRLEPIETTVRK